MTRVTSVTRRRVGAALAASLLLLPGCFSRNAYASLLDARGWRKVADVPVAEVVIHEDDPRTYHLHLVFADGAVLALDWGRAEHDDEPYVDDDCARPRGLARLQPGDEVSLGEFTGLEGGRVVRTITWVVDDGAVRLDWVEAPAPGSKELTRTTTSRAAVRDRAVWVRSPDASAPVTVAALVPVLPVALALDLVTVGLVFGTFLVWMPLLDLQACPSAVRLYWDVIHPIVEAWPVLPGG